MSDHRQTPQAISQNDPRRWFALAILLSAAFMNIIDVTIVNIALPIMQTTMDASSSQIEWVVAAYVMAFALFLLPFGRLGDILGKGRLLIGGVVAFTIMSGLCGLAPNIEILVVARILQGVAGAAIMPQVLSIIQDIFPPNERAKAFAFFGVAAGSASVAGPLVGGFLIELNIAGLDWRPIFLINIPLGVGVLVLALRNIPKIPGNPDLTVDWGGMVIVSIAVFCLVFPLVEGRTFGWPWWIFGIMVSCVPAFVAFVFWERFRDQNQKSQLLPMSLISNRNYMVGTFIVMAFFSGLPGFFMVLALFFQTGYGLSPFESGLATAPFPIGILISSAAVGRMGGRFMRSRLVIGILMVIVAMLWTRQNILDVSGELIISDFVGSLFLTGVGVGVAISVIFQTVLAGVPSRDSGSGSGGLQAFQHMGGAIGIALIGQIFFSTLAANGGGTPESFSTAGAAALIYDIVIFAIIIILSMFLRTVAHGDEAPQNAAPA